VLKIYGKESMGSESAFKSFLQNLIHGFFRFLHLFLLRITR